MKAVFDLSGPAPILLFMNRICLPVITIVALHFSTQLWDFSWSNEDSKVDKKKIRNMTIFRGDPYFSGAMWGLNVGLWGLGSIVFFVLSFFVQFPKWLKWIYVAGAVSVMFSASCGLGMNIHTANHANCMKGPPIGTARSCSVNLQFLSPIVFIFAISYAHALTFIATFLLAHFGEGGDVGCPCLKKGGSGNQDQAAGDQQIQDQPLQPRMSATKAPPMDAEAPPP